MESCSREFTGLLTHRINHGQFSFLGIRLKYSFYLVSDTFDLSLQSSYSVSYQAQSGSETNYADCNEITETTCSLMFDTGMFPAPHSFTIRVYANKGTQRSTAASLSAQTDDPGAPPDIVSVVYCSLQHIQGAKHFKYRFKQR